jgi:hypothetical protein
VRVGHEYRFQATVGSRAACRVDTELRFHADDDEFFRAKTDQFVC